MIYGYLLHETGFTRKSLLFREISMIMNMIMSMIISKMETVLVRMVLPYRPKDLESEIYYNNMIA